MVTILVTISIKENHTTLTKEFSYDAERQTPIREFLQAQKKLAIWRKFIIVLEEEVSDLIKQHFTKARQSVKILECVL